MTATAIEERRPSTMAAGDAIIPTSRVNGYGKPVQAILSLNRMVSASTMVVVSRNDCMMKSDEDLEPGAISRSMLNLTAAVSYAVPSLNLMFGFNFNVHSVKSAFGSSDPV